MRFRALGPLVLEVSPNDIRPLSGKLGRVVTTLLAHSGEVVSPERLIDAVWGESPPKSARNALQVYVSQLRSLLDDAGAAAPFVTTNANGYCLTVGPSQFDVPDLEALVARARAHDNAAVRADMLDAALGMWTGRAYEPWDTDEDIRPEAIRLEELRLNLEEERADAQLAAGKHQEVIDDLRRLADRQPLRERRWSMLMLALYRSGRQAEALRTYQRVRNVLGDELGIEPGSELKELEERILLQDPGLVLDVAPAPAVSNVPRPVGRIVGREQELDHLATLLAAGSRLVTIHGPGGIGKTRLAIEFANDVAATGHFDQVTMVALDSVDATESIDAVVAPAVTGNPDHGGSSADAIGDRRILLVLDNCEHLSAAVAALAGDILATCSNARVVATSRSTLKVAGEARLAVGPLPAADAAGELFSMRAAEAGYRMPVDAVADVAAICEALEGVPLAIELAAARLSILSLPELRQRLGKLSLLEGDTSRPARHRSVSAAVEWSYDLLDQEHRDALATLAVFRGGFTADAAEYALSGRSRRAPLTVVSVLHDAGLLMRSKGRLRMLEPVRQFAEQRLNEAGRAEDAVDRLASWVIRHVEDATSRLGTPDNLTAVHGLDGERGNIGVALRHLEQHDHERFAATVGRLAEYWWRIGDLGTGDRWIAEAIEAAEPSPRLLRHAAMFLSRVRPDTDAAALLDRLRSVQPDGADIRTAEAHVAWSRGDMVAARALFESAAEAQRKAHDGEMIDTLAQLSRMRLAEADTQGALALANELEVMGRAGERADAAPLAQHVRGLAYAFGGDHAAAEPLMAAAARGFEDLGMVRQLVGALRGLGMVHANLGDLEGGRQQIMRSLELARSIGDGSAVMFAQIALGLLAADRNEPEVAAGLVDRALRQAVVDRDDQATAWCLFASARVAQISGDGRKAAMLLAASDRLVAHWRLGAPSTTWGPDDPMAGSLVAAMGQDGFDDARAEGASLGKDAAVELALGYPIGWVKAPPRR